MNADAALVQLALRHLEGFTAVVVGNEHLCGQVGPLHMPAARPGMLGGDDHDKFVLAQGLDMQPVCVRGQDENSYVQGAAQQALHRSIRILRGHEQFHMRILCTKFPQDMWQNLIATITRRAHP